MKAFGRGKKKKELKFDIKVLYHPGR